MTHREDEPPTRALSALELQACLEAQREPEVLTSAITRVAIQRSEQAGLAGFAERAEAQLTRTAINVVSSPASCQETRLALPRRTRGKPITAARVPAAAMRVRTRLLAFAAPLLAVAFAGFFMLRPRHPSQSRRVSSPAVSAPALGAAVQFATAQATPHTPTDRAPASPRRAVDLLLSGHTRDALDAYRSLALEQPAEPAYALIVELLERDLAACRGEGEGACQ